MKPLYFRCFDLVEVVVPAHEELVTDETGATASWPLMPIVLVMGHLSSGEVALGEMVRGISREQTKDVLRRLAGLDLHKICPAVHWNRGEVSGGANTLFPEGSWEALGNDGFCLLECLILDALGRELGRPVNFFWGGSHVRRVSADFWCFRPSPKQARVLARQAVEKGFRGLKMKAALNEGIIETARAMRDEVGRAFRLTIDPMCAWRSFGEASFIFQALSGMEGYWQIEDPFPHTALDCWRQARARHGLPLIWHARNVGLARTGLELGIADGYNFAGNGSDFLYAARAAQFMGMSCWHGSGIELGVRQHFILHAASAAPNATLGNDLCSEMVRRDTLVYPRMEICNGMATVPEGPGLGVSLDEAAVEKYAVAREVLTLD